MTAAAKETPWLRLARISDDQKENKRLWNGYQKYLLRPNRGEYQRQMENPEFADIVDLSDAEIRKIQTRIPDFPKVLSGLPKKFRNLILASEEPGAIFLTKGIEEIKTPLELHGFYFAFRVFIRNTRFKSELTLQHAQFAAGLGAIECIFEEGLDATAAKFESDTSFYKCQFIEGTSFRDAKFKKVSNFSGASFEDYCVFENAEFAGRAFFTDSIFTNSSTFKSVKFHGVTFFNLAAASSAAAPLSFKDAKFCKHPQGFLAARCMKIPIGRVLNCQTPEERLLNASVSKRTTNAPMIRFRWPVNHGTPKRRRLYRGNS